MPALAAFLVALVFVLVGNRCARAASRRRAAARERLRERFVRFVDDNRHRSVTEDDIERFLVDTVEVGALCPGTALPRLRPELLDQALRLSRLRTALENGWGGEGLRSALADGCAERRAWFDRVAPVIDSPLKERRTGPLERFNRAIGA